MTHDHPHLNSDTIAATIRDYIKAKPDMPIDAVREIIKTVVEKMVLYKKAWVGKQKAIASIFGDWKESYQSLSNFMKAQQKYNSGTVVNYIVKLISNGRELYMLDKIFFAFQPCINGFAYCQPVVTIDVSHVYGKYKGKLMIAMSCDEDNRIFSLAFAFIREESDAS